ncbi:hypothetical protein QTS76_00255, partial [Micromonospora sp. b486]|nr:hypothetical protein [Micromonospora sp. b486]
MSTSALGGFAGGAVAPLAGLGRHANGRFAEIGERFGREMAGETLAETAAGLATGQGPSLEDLARAAASGATGSATNQADSALQRRLDGQLSGLTVSPVGLDVPVAADPVGLIPAQRVAEPIVQSGETIAGAVPVAPTHVTPQAAGPHPLAVDLPRPAPESTSTLSDAVPHDGARPTVTTSPTLSSVITDAPVASSPSIAPGVHNGAGPVATPINHPAPSSNNPIQVAAAPATLPAPSADHPQVAAPPTTDRAAPISNGGQAGPPPVAPVSPQPGPYPGAPAVGPEPRPGPNPRFPLLESLAPLRDPTDSPGPHPGPFDVQSRPRETAEQRAARLKADREGLDRRRYQGYLQSQRALHEENRRQAQIKELRDLAEQHYEAARWLLMQAHELRQAGRHDLADRHVWEGRRRERLHYRAVDEVEAVRAGQRLPREVMVEDDLDFYRINDDVADLAVGAVETADHSALTGHATPSRSTDPGPTPPGRLRPPLALHQTDLERQMPRNPDGSVTRTADPRRGGGSASRTTADRRPTHPGDQLPRLHASLFETWVHGRPRVAAPRTFDGYLHGDVNRPVGGGR